MARDSLTVRSHTTNCADILQLELHNPSRVNRMNYSAIQRSPVQGPRASSVCLFVKQHVDKDEH